jgi:hypothetical protein
MRPTREETDLEYWLNAASHWAERASEWFLLTASRGITPEDEAWFEERRTYALEMEFRANLKYQEARGDIEVYTGRAKPRWA